MYKAIGVLLILAPAPWLAWQMLTFHIVAGFLGLR